MHGGLSPNLRSLDQLRRIARPCDVQETGKLKNNNNNNNLQFLYFYNHKIFSKSAIVQDFFVTFSGPIPILLS